MLSTSAYADSNLGSRLNVKSNDGTVNTYPYQIRLPNGSLRDNSDGTVTLSTSASFPLPSGDTSYAQIGGALQSGAINLSSGSIQAFTSSTATLQHLVGSSASPTTVIGTGAGSNATTSLTGTDLSGQISITTSALDTPSGAADIVTITFGVPYAAAPDCVVMASNDTSANLAYGVWRYRQSDTTVFLFKIRSGNTPLTALTAATYTWNYVCNQ